MRKIIGLFGEPGVGKSYLAKSLILKKGISKRFKIGLIHFLELKSLELVIGRYFEDDGLYDGTDRLSYTASKDLLNFLQSFPTRNIFFEGDRFANTKSLTVFEGFGKCEWFELSASQDVLEERRTLRGSNQDPGWLKSRRTKLDNLKKEFPMQVLDASRFEENLDILFATLGV